MYFFLTNNNIVLKLEVHFSHGLQNILKYATKKKKTFSCVLRVEQIDRSRVFTPITLRVTR